VKVLFISSGKSGDTNIIIKNQAVSLRDLGVEISFYLIKGKGIVGYLKHIFLLRNFIRTESFDLYHAHYSFSGITAALAGCRPLVVSLMGSDAYTSGFFRQAIRFFARKRWDLTIVKTEEMRSVLNLKNSLILPNGVDTVAFQRIDKSLARKTLGLPQLKKIILFVADPSRPEKNYSLAVASVEKLKDSECELLPVYSVQHSDIPIYMSAADLLLLTSRWEGSVNVVKEAMSSELPVVSTDVGDVKMNISGLPGNYIAGNDPEDIADKIRIALAYKAKTGSRQRLTELELDSRSVAQKLVKIYNDLK